MEKAAKSYIIYSIVKGELFKCKVGVIQGENLSPLLFALYINNLHEFLPNSLNWLQMVGSMIEFSGQVAYCRILRCIDVSIG